VMLAEDPSARTRVFISYRRRGGARPAGQIAADLSARMPDAVFHDARIKAGDNFLEAIERNLDACDVLVAVIHPRWTVFDDDDFLGLELRTALARGMGIVPVLVDGARMPSAQELAPELRALAGCPPLELATDLLVARVEEHLRAADERRALIRPQLEARNGNLCWNGVLRGEQAAVHAALLGCMVREHGERWTDTAPYHEITWLHRRSLRHVAQLTVRLAPGAAARTTAVELTAEPTLRRALERTVAATIRTRRLESGGLEHRLEREFVEPERPSERPAAVDHRDRVARCQ
jgi:hypothetical protein